MNPQSLHALIIDRHSGELSPEAVELLDLHLAHNADARVEAERIVQSLAVTRDAVLRHPELARVAPVEKVPVMPLRRPSSMTWLARAAAVILLAALTGVCGYMAGRNQSQPAVATGQSSAPVVAMVASHKQSPWAQYRMTFDPTGSGMQVVRVDVPDAERKALR